LPTLYIYDPAARAFSSHALALDAQMPHVNRFTFKLRDFLGRAAADVCWTDLRALAALDELCLLFGRPLVIGRAFCRAGTSGAPTHAQHGTGTAFDLGANLRPAERQRLRVLALESGLFAYAEPAFLSGTVAHLSLFSGLPQRLSAGEASVFAFLAQDALLFAGAFRGTLTGVVCQETLLAARRLGLAAVGQNFLSRGALAAALTAARD